MRAVRVLHRSHSPRARTALSALAQERLAPRRARLTIFALLPEHRFDVTDAVAAFSLLNSSGDGHVSYREFKHKLVEVFHVHLERSEMHTAWQLIDADSSGYITFSEFATSLFPELDDDELLDLIGTNVKFQSHVDVGGASSDGIAVESNESPQNSANQARASWLESMKPEPHDPYRHDQQMALRLDKLETMMGQLLSQQQALVDRGAFN